MKGNLHFLKDKNSISTGHRQVRKYQRMQISNTQSEARSINLHEIAVLPAQVSAFLGRIGDFQAPTEAQEAEIVRNAVEKRKNEFFAGRNIARLAMRKLSLNEQAILQNDRAPAWPDDVTGSITHCDTHCAAAVSTKDHFASIGIDLEIIGKVTPDLWGHVFTEAERQYLSRASSEERDFLATAIFSAKEALYKLQHPITGQWLGFEQVEVRIRNRTSFTITSQTDLGRVPRTLGGLIASPAPELLLAILVLPFSETESSINT